MRSASLTLLAVALLTIHALPEPASAETPTSILDHLASKQLANGRWSLTSQGYIGEAAASLGADVKRWPTPEQNAFAAQTPETCGWVPVTDQQDCIYKSLLRVVHGLGVAGYDPRKMPDGTDGVERVRAGFVGNQFGGPVYINDDVWAIFALRAAGVPADDAMVRSAAQYLRAARAPDGGWSERTVGAVTSVDMTGMALAALKAAGETVAGDAAAVDHLREFYDPAKGGFASTRGGSANCQSSVWAIHAYAALGMENASALAYVSSLVRGDGSVNGNLWCTVEAAVVLGGGRYPLPSFTPTAPPAPRGFALEATPLTIGAPFTRATWTFDDGTIVATGSRNFTAAGVYPYQLLAESDRARVRLEGKVTILSARPILGAFPQDVAAARHAPVTLDLRGARDPDNAIARFIVDWGDGNATTTADRLVSHAYPTHGGFNVSIVAVDETGVESPPARIAVRVQNAAPAFGELPTRIVTDRVRGVQLPLDATDPDRDALRVTWTLGETRGEGNVTARPTRAGNLTLELRAEDPFGANATRSVPVEILNLPPTLAILGLPEGARPGDEIALAAEASDPDGDAPRVTWSIRGAEHEGARIAVRLGEGTHEIVAHATDADGANAEATATLVVADRPVPVAPEITDIQATLNDGALVVRFAAPTDARVTLNWRTDTEDGALQDATSPAAIPLPGATWAMATLVAQRDGLTTSRDAPIALAPAPQAQAQPRAPPPPPSPVVVEPAWTPPAPTAELRADEPAAEPASVTAPQPEESRATPALPLAALLGAALVATLRRRAA